MTAEPMSEAAFERMRPVSKPFSTLDALVYRRTGGQSLATSQGREAYRVPGAASPAGWR